MEDTEEDNSEEVGDCEREVNDKTLIYKVERDQNTNQISTEKNMIIQDQNRIRQDATKITQDQNMIGHDPHLIPHDPSRYKNNEMFQNLEIVKDTREICAVGENVTFKINNNLWKCEMEINI